MKHAFLIIAHNEPEVLEELIKRLNHPDIKLFIHIDKKANFNIEEFKKNNTRENIVYLQSEKIYWGTYSQINITYKLLKLARSENFDYYHLVSGTTLPIKDVKKILEFYNLNKGKEFVKFFPSDPMLMPRLDRYHIIPRQYSKFKIIKLFDKAVQFLPRKIDYNQNYYKKSHNWFSCTQGFIDCLLSREPWVRKQFKLTLCCDEVFVATILFNSPFYKQCYFSNMLYVDWDDIFKQKSHSPCILNYKYIDILKKTDCLFARKFDSTFKDFYYKLFE